VTSRRGLTLVLAVIALVQALGLHVYEARSETAGEALSVLTKRGWRVWWRADTAPALWAGPLPLVATAVAWTPMRPGLELGTVALSGSGEAARVRVALVRVDPARYRFRTVLPASNHGYRFWTVDSATADVALAFNAGHFDSVLPWGWVVRDGIELQPPGHGPLSMAAVVNEAGAVALVPFSHIDDARRRRPREALQSYPTLLLPDGRVPDQLLRPGAKIDLRHRDARLALCELRDHRILIALTRFDLMGPALSSVPFGLTVPEMAGLMGALDCRSAMLLDGGLSGQLMVRDTVGTAHRFRGWREVPMGVAVTPRTSR
jgi:hypothetical protein